MIADRLAKASGIRITGKVGTSGRVVETVELINVEYVNDTPWRGDAT